MADDTNTAEREAFEAWARSADLSIERIGDRPYFWQFARWAWDAWLARASLAASAGSEPVANNRPSLEAVFRGLSDRAYCNYIEQMRRDVCLGWEHKAKHGKFGETELKGHTKAGEMLGRHKAFAEAANALRGSDAPLTHLSPTEGMAGWKLVPIKPTPEMVEAGRWMEYGESSCHMGSVPDGDVIGVWQSMIAAAPPLPASEAKEL